jgi:hypothetical protein
MSGKHKETGQYAYEAYAAAVNYRNYQGGMMPQWLELPEEIRNAWREAAHAVMRYGWQSPEPPETPRGWERVEGYRPVPGLAGAWEVTPGKPENPGEDTRTSHRVR